MRCRSTVATCSSALLPVCCYSCFAMEEGMQKLVQPEVCDMEVRLMQECGRPTIVCISMEWELPVQIKGEGH